MRQSLSPRQLARAIGVSESSLKRWADEGRVHVNRTLGGHRRIPVQEAIRFSREEGFPIARPELLGLPNLDSVRAERHADTDLSEYLFEKLRAERADEACAVLVDLYLSGRTIASLIDGPVLSAISKVGEIWLEHKHGIFLEHRAIDICVQSLQFLRAMIRQPGGDMPTSVVTQADGELSSNGHRTTSGSDNASAIVGEQDPLVESVDQNKKPAPLPVAVGGAVAGDPYLLPSLCAACVMAEVGYREINLGPDLPVDSFREAARYYKPRVLWVSCSIEANDTLIRGIETLARDLAEINTRVVVGGRGVAHLPAVISRPFEVCRTMSEMAAFARGLRGASA